MDLKGSTISKVMNATFSARNGKVTATSVSYHTSIAPGASVSFGFCANVASASAQAVLVAWNMQVNNPACSSNSGAHPAKAALAVKSTRFASSVTAIEGTIRT